MPQVCNKCKYMWLNSFFIKTILYKKKFFKYLWRLFERFYYHILVENWTLN